MRVTAGLLAAIALVFMLELQFGTVFLRQFALWPLGHGFAPWQLFSSGFLHADLFHLAMNMFGLWIFGRDIERVLGGIRFLQLYGASLLTGSLTQLVVVSALGTQAPTLGASGAVFGLLGAFALLFPRRRMLFLLLPVPIPARLFVLLYALFELGSGVTGSFSGIAHFAHLGGLVGGLLLLRVWRQRPMG